MNECCKCGGFGGLIVQGGPNNVEPKEYCMDCLTEEFPQLPTVREDVDKIIRQKAQN